MPKFGVIDADSHVLEPPDLWKNYIEPRFRSEAPELYRDAEGRDCLRIQGRIFGQGDKPIERGIGHLGAFGAAWGHGPLHIKYSQTVEGHDPRARLRFMEAERHDATCLYPSIGLMLGGIADPELSAACCRAYNRWLFDFCREDPKRLLGAAMVPFISVEKAIAELRYARKELGFKTVFLRPNPHGGRVLHSRENDPFWAAVEELDMSVALHSGSASDLPTVAMDRYADNSMTRHLVSHTVEIALGCLSLIMRGVCERFPKVRFALFESGGGWVAGWLDRMDRHFEKTFSDAEVKTRPSDVFRRQCWVAFDPAEGSLHHVAEYIGIERVLFATDYPHPDGVPDATRYIRESKTLSPRAQQRILYDNAAAFFGL